MGLFDRPNISKLRDKGKVRKLIKLLNYTDRKENYFTVRDEAQAALEKIGARAVVPLINALSNRDEDYRRSAAEMLGKLGDPRAVVPLIKAMKVKDEDFLVRRAAADALGKIGDPSAVEPLITLMKDEDFLYRDLAVDALGKIGDPRAVEPLINLLDAQRGDHLSNRVIEALEKINDPRAITVTINMLGSNFSAKEALEKLGSPAVELLISALRDERAHVRINAADVLGSIGDPRAVVPLINVLKDEKSFAAKSAIGALGKIGDPRAVEPLVDALRNEDIYIRSEAAMSLDKLGWRPENVQSEAYYLVAKKAWDKCVDLGTPAVEPLVNALRVKQDHIRSEAAMSLDKLGWRPENVQSEAYYLVAKREWDKCVDLGVPAVEPLINLLRDRKFNKYGDSRWSPIEALGRIGDPRAVESVINVMVDRGEENHIRKIAATTLGKIGDPKAVKALIYMLKLKGEYMHELRRTAAEALKTIYHNGKLDMHAKQEILSCRQVMNQTHDDSAHHYNDCVTHTDTGIGISFDE